MTQSIQLTEHFDLNVKDIVFDKVTNHTVKKTKVSYQRIPISLDYRDGTFGPLIIKTPTCQTCGVRADEMDGGVFKYSLPLTMFDKPVPTKYQEEWMKMFYNIVRRVKDHLLECDYNEERLSKLASCMWEGTAGPIMYVGLVDSPNNVEYSSRFFISNEEVTRQQVAGNFDATAAVRVDSIYIGAKAISIQVRLYEVELKQRGKRDRVL